MAARGRKFSWMRLITNAIPNFANDSPNDVDLSPTQADQLVTYQLGLPFPLYLGPLSFFMAQITTSKSVSAQIHRALLKNAIIAAPPAAAMASAQRKMSVISTTSTATSTSTSPIDDNDESLSKWSSSESTVRTSGITRHFANQLSMISIHAQRKLVALLFFWEEECTRWKLLEQEEEEIVRAMQGLDGAARGGGEVVEGDEGRVEREEADAAMLGDAAAVARKRVLEERRKHLDMARRAVQMRRSMLPSKRAEATANVADGVGHELPAYM